MRAIAFHNPIDQCSCVEPERRILTPTPKPYLSQVEAVSTARIYAGRGRESLRVARHIVEAPPGTAASQPNHVTPDSGRNNLAQKSQNPPQAVRDYSRQEVDQRASVTKTQYYIGCSERAGSFETIRRIISRLPQHLC
ncbi:hypothetical protein DTO013E5_5674 [Penicillium roqueforti]|uniref:uncharacterized protein n=1 Tax=Penicillium roqueforti TaxID=5082 RepID=UPI00190C83B6|nr:uncharacterized protein LCP9604111_9499 [Penicillium roqueforti]KAF9238295.1 hypothetical protein LCP9604111_9499 [Penicillium roqueforti]KAI1830832.1 hypothetical protein CBS147337_8449 [Penicillium roqueforti]KAI2674422.1 hypothetical protein CBS147355_7036 [Penicillium roqueforti]KAI2683920.1 hypothetical protein LCP963914a_5750 [Penicillium roqueforti]KAI2696853.1 hypothetical protein CBS147372_8272 [Penicillium roqueforti]